jgi:hypothetical protein
MKFPKWLSFVPMTWALLPWLFWCVFQFHKPDHADPFWLPAIPFIYVSFIPMMLFGHDSDNPNWFPLGWVAGSSVFNLAAGALLSVIIWFMIDTKNDA